MLWKKVLLFLISKVWNDRHGEGEVLASRSVQRICGRIIWTSIWCIGPFPIIMRPAVPATPGTLIPVPSAYRNS